MGMEEKTRRMDRLSRGQICRQIMGVEEGFRKRDKIFSRNRCRRNIHRSEDPKNKVPPGVADLSRQGPRQARGSQEDRARFLAVLGMTEGWFAELASASGVSDISYRLYSGCEYSEGNSLGAAEYAKESIAGGLSGCSPLKTQRQALTRGAPTAILSRLHSGLRPWRDSRLRASSGL